MKKLTINENKLPQTLVVVSVILCVIVAYLSRQFTLDAVGIENLSARSEDNKIQLSWTCMNPNRAPLELLIKTSKKQYKVELPYNAESYEFIHGKHGQMYTISLSVKGEETIQTVERLFLDWDQLPDLPIVTIETVNGVFPSYRVAVPEEGYWGSTIVDNEYVAAKIKLSKQDKVEVDAVGEIRYRGNTSATLGNKKPYAIKLDQPLDMLGRDSSRYSDRQWVLLPGNHSFTTESGLFISKLCGLEWQPEFIPVNVMINGDWQGQYYLVESVKQSTARVNISNDGFLIENNAYWWKEGEVYFKTPKQMKEMGYTFKYPETETMKKSTKDGIIQYMTEYEEAVLRLDDSFIEYIDVDSFCGWLLTHDILGNRDGGGSNIYLSKYSLYDDSKLKLGPAWDFDRCFKTENDWSTIHNYNQIMYFSYLMMNQTFRETYQEKWRSVSDVLCESVETFFGDYVSEYGNALQKSWELEFAKYKIKPDSVQSVKDNAISWFQNRKIWIDGAIENP